MLLGSTSTIDSMTTAFTWVHTLRSHNTNLGLNPNFSAKLHPETKEHHQLRQQRDCRGSEMVNKN